MLSFQLVGGWRLCYFGVFFGKESELVDSSCGSIEVGGEGLEVRAGLGEIFEEGLNGLFGVGADGSVGHG